MFKSMENISEHDKLILKKIHSLYDNPDWTDVSVISKLVHQLENGELKERWINRCITLYHLEEARIGAL